MQVVGGVATDRCRGPGAVATGARQATSTSSRCRVSFDASDRPMLRDESYASGNGDDHSGTESDSAVPSIDRPDVTSELPPSCWPRRAQPVRGREVRS